MCGIVVSLACVPFAVLLDIALGSALSRVSANVVAELFRSPAIVVKLGVASTWVSPGRVTLGAVSSFNILYINVDLARSRLA